MQFGALGEIGFSLEQILEIILEGEHDFLRLRARIVFHVGRDVLEETERLGAELAEDALARQLALDEAAIGAAHRRGEEIVRLRG